MRAALGLISIVYRRRPLETTPDLLPWNRLRLVGRDSIGLGDVDPVLRLLDQVLEQPEVSHRDQGGQRLARAADDHPLAAVVYPVHQVGDVFRTSLSLRIAGG